jgi:hypothetical protein
MARHGKAGERILASLGGRQRTAEEAGGPRAVLGYGETFLVLAAMFLLMYRPHFADAGFNYAEEGLYLGNIYAIFQGKIPYRDIFMQFGPLNDYLPALALKLFGPTIYTLRAYFFLAAIFTVLASWLLARKCLRTRPFLYVTAFVLVYEVFSPKWALYWGGLRHVSGLLVVLAMLKFMESARPRLWLFLAGVLCGLSLLTSIEVGLFATAASGLLLMVLAWHRGLSLRDFLGQLLPLVGGWALVMIPMLAYFLAHGALQEYLRIAFYDVPFNHMAKFGQRRLISLGPGDYGLKSLLAWTLSTNFKMYLPFGAFAAGAWLCLKAWRQRNLTSWHFMVFLLLAYGLPLYLVSFRQFGGPQSQASYGPAIILGLALLERLSNWLAPAGGLGRGGLLSAARLWRALVPLGVCLYLVTAQHMIYVDFLGFLNAKRANYALINGRDPNLVPLRIEGAGGIWTTKKDARELTGTVEYLKEYTKPGEAILVVPEDGAYFFLADRPNLLRFSTPAMAYTAERFQVEILEQLKKHAVRIVVKRNKTSGHAKHAGKADYDLLPNFYDCLNEFYPRKSDIGPVSILLHRDMPLLTELGQRGAAAAPRQN